MNLVIASESPTNQFSRMPWLLLDCSLDFFFLCDEDAMLYLFLPAPVYQKTIPGRERISNNSLVHEKMEINIVSVLNLDSL